MALVVAGCDLLTVPPSEESELDSKVKPYTKETIDEAPSKTWLIMKWSDTWLSNKDCNGDGKLDRGYDCDLEIL